MNILKNNKANSYLNISELFLSNYKSKSRFAEAFRTLRTNIQFSFMEKDFNTLLITSAGQEEGKTSTVANLSYTMAKAGKRVLMIDADLRKPSLSSLIDDKNGPGFSGLLSDILGNKIKEGNLADYSFSDLYRLISLQDRSGWLRMNDDHEQVDLLFVNGALKDINWINRPEEDKLANMLVQENILEKEDIKRVIARQKVTGKKFGYTILSMGLLSEEEINGILARQMTDALRNVLQFKSGTFSFKEISREEYSSSTFDPVDFELLYNQLIVGEEEFIYLNKGIEQSIKKTPENGLFLLPSGILPANPSELLSSRRVHFLLSILKKQFDRVIFDTPPVLPASDALILTPYTDGIIFVIKAGSMNRVMVKKAVESLQHSKANIIGTILNQVDIAGEGYYKNYYQYYSKYYGE